MIKILPVIFLCGIILSGCAAVSNRYTQRTETEEQDTSLRYSNNENKDIAQSDSSLYDEDEPEYQDEEFAALPEDDAIDISEVMSRFPEKKDGEVSVEYSTAKEKTLMEIIKYLNTPYKYGGNSKKGIDCSAFTQTIYNNALSINLLRSAREQYKQGAAVDKSELQFGDLVFFNTRRRVRPGHVGIYIGDNLFAHASSKHGVIITSLGHEYYTRTYMGARRIENTVF